MEKLSLEWTFEAPIEKVWKALTEADELKKWWCPDGFTAADISVDLKEGGIFRYCFKGEGDLAFWGRGVYQKIEEPKFLSYLDTFTDSDGNPVPASHYGIPGNEVVETMVELSLSSEAKTTDGEVTKIKMLAENPYDESMLEDMKKGWNGMFEKLRGILG